MKLMRLAALAVSAFFAACAATNAATPTSTTAVEALSKNQGEYQVTIGGQTETIPVDRFCTGSTSVEFASDNHDGFTFTVTRVGDQLTIGNLSVDLTCPPPFGIAAMRSALVADLATRDYLQEVHVTTLLQAFDAGSYRVAFASVSYPSNQITVDGEAYSVLATPYAPRLSEGNFFLGHLRDEYPDGVQVLIIQTESLRFSVLWTECDGAVEIEKLAIGQVVVRTIVRNDPQPERRVVVQPSGYWQRIDHQLTMSCFPRGSVPRGETMYRTCDGVRYKVIGGSLSQGTHRQAWRWVVNN